MDWPVERTATQAADHPDGVLSDLNFGEIFPFVVKPLAKDYLTRYVGPLLASQFAGLPRTHPLSRQLNPMAFVAGRPYMDLSAYFTLPGIAWHLGSLESADSTKGAAVVALAKTGLLRPLRLSVFARLSLYTAYARLSLQSALWLLRLQTPVNLLQAYRDRTAELRVLVRQPVDQVPSAALLRDLDERFSDTGDPTSNALRHLGIAFFLYSALQEFLSDRVSTVLVHDLGQGIPNSFTTEISLDLWRLAEKARHMAAVFTETPPDQLPGTLNTTMGGRQWWAQFEEVLMRHGHRGEVELDITTPRWREAPRFLLQTVTNYLRHPEDQSGPAEMLKKAIGSREAAAAAIRTTLPQLLRLLFDWLYSRYVVWMPFREAGKYTWLLWLERCRTVYRELGRRLVAEGQLHAVDDVFWLHLGELSSWAESGQIGWSAAMLKERERQWVAWSSLRPPPLLIGSHGVEEARSFSSPASVGAVLRGTPASSGQAEGIARVMTDPRNADLRKGEILVTRYTDPAWTPLFFTAAALVTEVGGVLSHGAVIAREIGLPAIVGVAGVTSRIRSGQRVRVNATEGTVEVL